MQDPIVYNTKLYARPDCI